MIDCGRPEGSGDDAQYDERAVARSKQQANAAWGAGAGLVVDQRQRQARTQATRQAKARAKAKQKDRDAKVEAFLKAFSVCLEANHYFVRF